MEFWEQEQERIIKEQQELSKNHVKLTEEQIQKNIDRNWMEFVDEDGNKYYEPLIDNTFFIDASDMKIPKEKSTLGIILLIVFLALAGNVLCFVLYSLFFFN
jgi:hypothetical protein